MGSFHQRSCTFCISKFKKNPEKYVAGLPAFNNEDASTSSAPDSAPAPLAEETAEALTPEQALAADTREHLPPFLQFLGKLHPIVVHFPIALILAALLAEILALTNNRWKPTCETSARFMLPLGALGAAPAVLFGWFAADGAGKAGELGLLIYRHRWLGVITLGVALIATLLQYFATRYTKPKLTWLYKAALLLAAVLVGITGHLGGLIVYGLDRF